MLLLVFLFFFFFQTPIDLGTKSLERKHLLDQKYLPSEQPLEAHGLLPAMNTYSYSSSDRCYVKFSHCRFFCSIVMQNTVITNYLLFLK